MSVRRYVNVFIRKDIPLVDQMVQIGHSCLLAGAAFDPRAKDFLHLYQVEDESELIRIMTELDLACIMYRVFYEPGNASGDKLGYTSLATEPGAMLTGKTMYSP